MRKGRNDGGWFCTGQCRHTRRHNRGRTQMLERIFKLSENKTNVRTEIVAGITTFLTMAYIIFVNPDILKAAKMPFGAAFVATCVAAAIGCFLMAFLANYPIALAPGMGLNAYFAFGVVGGMGYSWQVALGCVFISAVIFFIITLLPIRDGQQKFEGGFGVPSSIAPVFLQMDLAGAFSVGLVTVVFAFLFVDLFDNTGTLIALAHRGGFMRPDGTVPRLNRALMSDSAAAMIGAAVGTSTTTSYIESASGINARGPTGLTAAVVGVLFILALFVSPLAGSIPAYATAPALLYVACLMARGLAEGECDDLTQAPPALHPPTLLP